MSEFTGLYKKIVNREEKISLVGLGYVGMPIAVAFSKKVKVIGYDLNKTKIDLLNNWSEKSTDLIIFPSLLSRSPSLI